MLGITAIEVIEVKLFNAFALYLVARYKCVGLGQASHAVMCVQATKVLEGLLPDEQVPQHHSRRSHDPDTEEIQQVGVSREVMKKMKRV